jgi:hypothetical protein
MANELNSPVVDRRIKACETVGKMAAKRDSTLGKE